MNSHARFSKRSVLTSSFVAAATAISLLTGCGAAAETRAKTDITATGRQILTHVGPIAEGISGNGETWNVGAILAMSGYGSFYGTTESTGIDLAVQHIKEAGGPNINVTYKDNKSGDAQAGVTGLRSLANEGVGVMLTDYIGDLGALFTPVENNKILTLDGGGGTGGFGREKPYFYGLRAETPGDAFAGIFKYVKATSPDVKRVAMVAADFGTSNDSQIQGFKNALKDAGLEFAGYEIAAGGTTDFSAVTSRVMEDKPDLIIPSLYGTDGGLFAKQYKSAGHKVPTIGPDFNSDALSAAGSAFNGFTFAMEYFDATAPTNDWAALAAKDYQEKYGKPMTGYAANYYEDVFALWALYRSVKESGGDVNNGDDLKAALEKNPKFPSVYGGSGATPGTIGVDLKTHSVSERSMGIYQWDGTKVITKATFNVGGRDMKIVK